MKGFIDIHSHILPQLDDGSANMEQTRRMVQIAKEEGIKTIITTPHYMEGRMMTSYAAMEEKLKQVQNDPSILPHSINFLPGCEIYYNHDSVRRLKEKKIPTLAYSNYVLVEFSPLAEFRYIKAALLEFTLEGYIPIIAHAERYKNLIKNLDLLEELIGQGAYVQVNAMSIMGKMGRNLKKISRKLLKNNLVHMIATDSHSDRKRAPKLQNCARYITRKYGEAYARELFIENPGKIISKEYI